MERAQARWGDGGEGEGDEEEEELRKGKRRD